MDGGDFNLIDVCVGATRQGRQESMIIMAGRPYGSIKEKLCYLKPPQVQTIIREVSADLETPVSLYLKLRGDGASFLLESVEGGERIARYSFIGVQPRAEYILRDGQVEIKDADGESRVVKLDDGDPTRFPAKRNEPLPRRPPAECAALHGWVGGLSRVRICPLF